MNVIHHTSWEADCFPGELSLSLSLTDSDPFKTLTILLEEKQPVPQQHRFIKQIPIHDRFDENIIRTYVLSFIHSEESRILFLPFMENVPTDDILTLLNQFILDPEVKSSLEKYPTKPLVHSYSIDLLDKHELAKLKYKLKQKEDGTTTLSLSYRLMNVKHMVTTSFNQTFSMHESIPKELLTVFFQSHHSVKDSKPLMDAIDSLYKRLSQKHREFKVIIR